MEEKKNKKIHKIYFVYLVVIVLQLLNLLYWADMKTNYHVDELFSMGYASSFTGAGDTVVHIGTSEDWKFNEWINNAELKKYLLVSEEESILRLSFPQAVVKLIKVYNYFGILNLAESLFGSDTITKWPGIMINLMCFIIADLLLLAIFTRLKMNKRSICLFFVLFGFCGYIVGLAEYIRFYMLVIMLSFVMILLHHVIWTTDKLWQVIVCELGSFAAAYLSLKDSELTIAFAGALIGCFWIVLLVTRKWKKCGIYSAVLLIGIIWLASKTPWLDILFNIGEYTDAEGQLGRLTSSIMGVSLSQIMSFMIWVGNLLADYLFGHRMILLLWGILFTFLFHKISVMKKNDRAVVEVGKLILWILWAGVAAVSLMHGGWTVNSIWIIISLIVFLILSVDILWPLIKNWLKVLKPNSEDGFVIVLTVVFAIYTIFGALADISFATRYYCFGFLSFIIILGYVTDRMIRDFPQKQAGVCYGILSVLIVTSSLIPLITRNIEYIYESDQVLISSLRPYQGMDTMVVPIINEDGTVANYSFYECVSLLNEETRIYPIEYSNYKYDAEIFPEEFLLWRNPDLDVLELIQDLETDGYDIQYLAEDQYSVVYVCKKL